MAVHSETSFGNEDPHPPLKSTMNQTDDEFAGSSSKWSCAAIICTVFGIFLLIVVIFLLIMLYGNPSNTRIFEWGARAARFRPEETALNRTYNYDGEVLIIGAGAAGLAAAKVLEKNQIRYSVLEATDRHGGRLMADSTFADFPVDLGAEWIHNLPTTLAVLSGAEDVPRSCWCPVTPFPPPVGGIELVPYHLEETHTWNGIKKVKNPAYYNDIVFRFFPEWKFKSSTWFDFYDEYIAKNAQNNIQYNAPVAEVDYSGERVQVTTAGGEIFVADKVIMTASIGVLKAGDIAFVPALSKAKKDAIDAVDFYKGFKLFLKFSEKFYSDALVIEESASGTTYGDKGYYDAAFKKEATDNVLAFLVTGSHVDPYYAMNTEEEIIAAVFEELDAVFDGSATRTFTGDYRFEDWGRKEFTKGTWVTGSEIEPKVLAEINLPLENKVFFAGEAHDVNRQLGVPAAIFSGFDAVDLMMRQSTSSETTLV